MPTITHHEDGLELFVNQLGTISLQQYEPALGMTMTVCIRPEHVEAVRQHLADLSAEAQQFVAEETPR